MYNNLQQFTSAKDHVATRTCPIREQRTSAKHR